MYFCEQEAVEDELDELKKVNDRGNCHNYFYCCLLP